MFIKILKTNEEVSIKNGTLEVTDDYWIIHNIADPEAISNEVIRRSTIEELKAMDKHTKLYIKDSDDSHIEYRITLHLGDKKIWITTDIYDDDKYLCGKIISRPYYQIYDFPYSKIELKLMTDICREYP